MNTKYWDGVDMLGILGWDKLNAAGVGEIKEFIEVESDSTSQDDIKPAF